MGCCSRVVYTFDDSGRQIKATYFDAKNREVPMEIVVLSVVPGSTAQRIGLAPGDRILSYEGKTSHCRAGREAGHGPPRRPSIPHSDHWPRIASSHLQGCAGPPRNQFGLRPCDSGTRPARAEGVGHQMFRLLRSHRHEAEHVFGRNLLKATDTLISSAPR